jgi:hypothetical protein
MQRLTSGTFETKSLHVLLKYPFVREYLPGRVSFWA